jgi:hypothetical protein
LVIEKMRKIEIRPHWCIAGRVLPAEHLEVAELSAPHDGRHRAGQPVAFDFGGQDARQAPECRRR